MQSTSASDIPVKRASDLFAHVATHPSMYLMHSTFAEAVAFIVGYEIARKGKPLKGFHDWLVARLGYGANLHWCGLVLSLTFPDAPNPDIAVSKSPENEVKAVRALFSLINEFQKSPNR